MSKRALIGVVAAVVLVAAGCGGTSSSGERAATSPPPADEVAETSAGGGDGPGDEGIQVHGHWRFDITNPDGTHDRTVEFENALVPTGQLRLAQLLGRERTPSFWSIWLGSGDPRASSPDHPCEDEHGNPNSCLIHESEITGDSPRFFDNLSVDVSGSDLVLGGSATAGFSASITTVQTELATCDSAVSPDDCTDELTGDIVLDDPSAHAMTRKAIDPVTVTAGQIVQVTVTLSFS